MLIGAFIGVLLVGVGVGYYIKKVGVQTAVAKARAAGEQLEDLAKRL